MVCVRAVGVQTVIVTSVPGLQRECKHGKVSNLPRVDRRKRFTGRPGFHHSSHSLKHLGILKMMQKCLEFQQKPVKTFFSWSCRQLFCTEYCADQLFRILVIHIPPPPLPPPPGRSTGLSIIISHYKQHARLVKLANYKSPPTI